MQKIIAVISLIGTSLHGVIAECPAQSPCEAASGVFPVPGDCSSFFNCAHCRPFQQQCGPGTLFDPVLGVCNHAHQVKCDGSRGNYGSSEALFNRQSKFFARSGKLDERVADREWRLATRSQAPPVPHPDIEHSSATAWQTDVKSGSGIDQRGHVSFSRPNTQAPGSNVNQTGDVLSLVSASQPQDGQHHIGEQAAHLRARVAAHGINRFAPISTSHFGKRILSSQGQLSTHNSQYSVAPLPHVTNASPESDHGTAGQQRPIPPAQHRQHVYDEKITNSDKRVQPQGTITEIRYPEGQVHASIATHRRQFDHAHITHHPEAVAFASTHQIVFDHSHSSHHLRQEDGPSRGQQHQPHHYHDQHEHFNETENAQRVNQNKDVTGQDTSRNNRGYIVPRVTLHAWDQNHGQYKGSFTREGDAQTAPDTESTSYDSSSVPFDLRNRRQSSSGYVPSFVQGQMGDHEVSYRVKTYGERVFVRKPNTNAGNRTNQDQETLQAETIDANGQPVEPNRFYADEEHTGRAFDDESEVSPADLTEEDLKRIIANQKYQYAYSPSTGTAQSAVSGDRIPFQQTEQEPQVQSQVYRQARPVPRYGSGAHSESDVSQQQFAPHLKQPTYVTYTSSASNKDESECAFN
ncbi:hypothetical protein BIW11_09231 [Tropilaelaps mercedesae]|uniref:Chitin-binding type-2 domain-containing protein n=1 Tax=Tropilaelaps mercedesae TaxID=418985 RepID=A0A1V9XL12_9ACAR|nr:hypothetical protein BIW11_09231 [Tropilaelaps mercedesae]